MCLRRDPQDDEGFEFFHFQMSQRSPTTVHENPMRIIAALSVALTILMITGACWAQAQVQASGNPFPDLDIGSLISEGAVIAKREASAEQIVRDLDALKEDKVRSDKTMADWKPNVEAYQQDCGKNHVWNKDNAADAATAEKCRERLGTMNPPYTKDRADMREIDARLAARGINQDQLSDWKTLLAQQRKEALGDYYAAVSLIKQWKVNIKVAQLVAPMQTCLRQTSMEHMTDEQLVQTFSQCWDRAKETPALTTVTRGTNAFSAMPTSDVKGPERAANEFSQSGNVDPGANIKRNLHLDDIKVPTPTSTIPTECSLMQWFTESSGYCEKLRRRNIYQVSAVRG